LSKRASRRAFLQAAGLLTAASLVGTPGRPGPSQASAGQRPAAGSLRIASALPLSFPHNYAPNLASWPSRALNAYDLVLAPAYAAAAFIARGAAGRQVGPKGRAHDPDGAYTVPFAYRVATVVRADRMAGAAWGRLWTTPGASWPDEQRLALGAALMHQGYSPNDRHPGRVAQAQADLLALRPAMSSLMTLGGADAGVALALLHPEEAARLPNLEEKALLLEYDWVIPAGARRAAAAAEFVAALTPALPPGLPGVRLIPLMPLLAA